MNNARRESISGITIRIKVLRDQIESIYSDVSDLESEESAYFQNMPEGFQSAEKGGIALDAIDNLGEAGSDLEDMANALEEVVRKLEEAGQ